MTTPSKKSPKPQEKQPDSPLAIVSLVLGVVSLTGPGLLLGIPAIITASIALKNKQGGRGLSIAGLVTGIVSTVVSLLFIAFIVLLIVVWEPHPSGKFEDRPTQHQRMEQTEHESLFESSKL